MRQQESQIEPAFTSALFFNVGELGAIPLGFAELFSDEFIDTKFVTSDAIRRQILRNRSARNRTKAVRRESIAARMMNTVAPILEGGEDVYADIFFNTPTSRSRTPVALTQQTESLCIALNIEAPTSIIKGRKETWRDAGLLCLPPANEVVIPSSATTTLDPNQKIAFASETENGIDFVFSLDGGTGPDGLLEQLEQQLNSNGLLGN